MVVACHYSPPGNIFGKFNQNVLAPKGESSSWMDARSISLRAGENGKLFFAFLSFCECECMSDLFPSGPVNMASWDKCHLGLNGENIKSST